MPELFPSVTVYVLCSLVVAGAQLIYATLGFGAGMFSIALLALLLPDLGPAVATLFVLTFVTEMWVLLHTWRQAHVRLLLGLLPTTAVGMWLGTELLTTGNVAGLKRLLGAAVACAGVWFLAQARRTRAEGSHEQAPGGGHEQLDAEDHALERRADANGPGPNAPAVVIPTTSRKAWASLPAGLAAGTLAGLFGTGGPPVIIFLRRYGLDKGAFRATLLWFFLLMSVMRGATYLHAGLLTHHELKAALWLLPASAGGMLAGMAVHHRLSEHHFAIAVSILLLLLGCLLAISAGA